MLKWQHNARKYQAILIDFHTRNIYFMQEDKINLLYRIHTELLPALFISKRYNCRYLNNTMKATYYFSV